ncbi:CBF-domain-containing protein, partial [Coprinellus micaceus]
MPAPTSLPQQSKKRRKLDHGSSVVSEIKSLEDELVAAVQANTSLNKLADLVDLVVGKSLEPRDLSKGIYALYRAFTLIISTGKLSIQGDGPAKAVKTWLWERLHSYTDFLVVLLKDEEKVLRTSSLQILFSLQKHLSTAQTAATSASFSRPEFHLSHFRKIVSGLLLSPSRDGKHSEIDPDIVDKFYETWFSVYDDIRWFFLRECVNVLEKAPAGQISTATNLLSILERLQTFPTDNEELNAWWVAELGAKPPKPKKIASEDDDEDTLPEAPEDDEDDDDDWRKFFDEPAPVDDSKKSKSPAARLHKMTVHQSLHSLPSHRAVFTRAWLALLPRLSAAKDEDVKRGLAIRALNVMHRGVLPHLTRAILAMDWIAGCVDHGGSVGLLALNGLFTLMRDYNLDYPSFYTRLYAFLDRDVLHLKHRARFFRMTELFLSSTHLPATLLASFIKRLSRLSLSAPPAAIVMIIPFTYNILKKHPALMVMIHRDGDSG